MKRKINLILEKDDEILERPIKKFGTASGHIIVPKKHVGKKAYIIFLSNSEQKKLKKKG